MRYLMLVFGLLFLLPANADPSAIGYVKTAAGETYVITGKSKVEGKVGTPVFVGSQLKTGPKSSMGVTFKDETVMSFGPDTDLTVDEYLYAPGQGKLKMGSKMAKGSMNYVSGVIAKLQPDAVTINTPTGTIGVRGTHFVVKVEE